MLTILSSAMRDGKEKVAILRDVSMTVVKTESVLTRVSVSVIMATQASLVKF